MKSKTVRETFLNYFKEKGHRIVPSSSLIPAQDPTLLFTNAGMNQFKDVFLGIEEREYKRATTCQKCLRAGGKHNDLENVGFTPRHHTFFEMLGNFSFGDYFKREAIEFAWELSTKIYKIDPEKIWVTVYKEDSDAYKIWKDIIKISEKKIIKLGEKDNFWAMGDTGPCGPCSELLYDLGKEFGCGRENCTPEHDCGRFLEFWNLVFMEFSRDEKGNLNKLPKPSIDTGAGLERVTSILQGVKSNYETDLFLPIINKIEEISNYKYGKDKEKDISVRVLSDHSKAVVFLISDGVLPSNEGRGYVLKRILRRAQRFSRNLKLKPPVLSKITKSVCEIYKDTY
ncbi:MAG: alanine--tRNA ligase, partial [Thermoanaerobaculia bacterium]